MKKPKILGIAFLFFGAALQALPLALNEKWFFYQIPSSTWETLDVVDLTPLAKAEKEILSLPGGIFSRETKEGNPALLVNEFNASSNGTMYLRCGVNCSYMQAGLNGKMIFDERTTSAFSAGVGNGSHILPLAVKKGRNVLSVKLFGSTNGSPDGKLRYSFAFAGADEEQYQQELPTRENFAAVGKIDRHIAERIIRNGVDQMTSTDFARFTRPHHFSAADLERCYRHYPVLEFYDRAFDKIMREVPETKIGRGAVVWHLYNMGYIVKTPACCFGIDICHRRAEELAPLLDFILVTHNHNDHYNLALLKAMAKAKKPVISNFYPAKGYQAPPEKITISDVTIDSERCDHNATLKKFVSVYRIQCGRSDDAPVIYHTGDSCDHRQLHPSGRVDIHILHPRVGLSVPEAAKSLYPREIWFSHLLEMGHCKPGIYRPVDWSAAYSDMEMMKKQGIEVSCRCPMWGEKIVLP